MPAADTILRLEVRPLTLELVHRHVGSTSPEAVLQTSPPPTHSNTHARARARAAGQSGGSEAGAFSHLHNEAFVGVQQHQPSLRGGSSRATRVFQ